MQIAQHQRTVALHFAFKHTEVGAYLFLCDGVLHFYGGNQIFSGRLQCGCAQLRHAVTHKPHGHTAQQCNGQHQNPDAAGVEFCRECHFIKHAQAPLRSDGKALISWL
jgi:hypothetical protein